MRLTSYILAKCLSNILENHACHRCCSINCAGTLLTAELALQHGLACNTAGGTHHAFPSFGSGFCILNDLAVTAEVLLHRKAVDRILILDLDVHQVC